MTRSAIKDLDNLPVVLTAKELQTILGVSKGTVYELFKRNDFPAIKCGRRLLISKEAFRRWLDREN